MTLSKAAWQQVRPEKLKGIDAGKLMEALKKKPGESIDDWKTCIENCDKLEGILESTPQKLKNVVPEEYRRALETWYGDIEKLRRDGNRALKLLGDEHVDDICTEHGEAVDRETRNLMKEVEKQTKEAKRGNKVQSTYERLTDEIVRASNAIRDMRKTKMEHVWSRDRMAQSLVGDKIVDMGSFRMGCDPMLATLAKELTKARVEYQKAMEGE